MKALKNADRPRNKEKVVSFLCMIQSNAEFIARLAQKTVNLREPTKKHQRFLWSRDCQTEFDVLKQALSDDVLLQYFDPKLHTFLFCDAHKTGLSAIISQGTTVDNSRPISFPNRTTTPIERRYAQLDLEALSVDCALRGFRNYLIGGPEVEVYTDNKPLISIFSSTRKGSVRTDRIKLLHQDVNYNVLWRAGKDNPADYLSRYATRYTDIPSSWKKETTELEKTIWFQQYSPYT